jgi:hypothetical protein
MVLADQEMTVFMKKLDADGKEKDYIENSYLTINTSFWKRWGPCERFKINPKS